MNIENKMEDDGLSWLSMALLKRNSECRLKLKLHSTPVNYTTKSFLDYSHNLYPDKARDRISISGSPRDHSP